MRGIRCFAVCSVLLLAGFAVPASAQVLSGPSLSNASSPNESSGSSANPSFQRFSNTQTVGSPTALTFQTRYFGNASADCGPEATNWLERPIFTSWITNVLTAPV